MNRTKIEWVKNHDGTEGYSWNPILGICPVECKLPNGKIYCYARKRYIRFNLDPTIRPAEEYPNVVVMPMYDRKQKIISRKVFVCSEFDLFHPSVKKEWRDWVFDSIKYNYHLTFQILTKFPHLIDRSMPDNVWLGVSITEPKEMAPRIKNLYQARAKLKFISFEPLLGDVGQFRFQGWLNGQADWIIIGRLTGHGRVFDPKDYWIRSLLNHAKKFNTPVFLKNNLKEIWAGRLIQEMPK